MREDEEAGRTLWPIRPVNNWYDFTELCRGFSQTGPASTTGYFFRGQSCSRWRLAPSLLRALPEDATREQAISIEYRATKEFGSKAHLHLASQVIPPSDIVDWWTSMQHYGAPTRLVDWTKSPYVAAYFAVSGNWGQHGAIWMFFVRKLDTAMAARFGHNDISKVRPGYFTHRSAREQLFAVEQFRKSDRMVAQQGGFTICTQVLGDHETIIHSCCAASGACTLLKLIIPREQKREFLKQLRAMNITASSLFPGADGLGRSVQELVLLDAGSHLQRLADAR